MKSQRLSNATLSPTQESDGPRFTPLYMQIHALITGRLQAGEWAPADMIPGEQELASQYGVSAGTVRKAIDRLVAEHVLFRRQGRGTFVGSHKEPRANFRFLRLRDAQDRVPQFSSRVLSCKKVRAPLDIARRLDMKAGEPLIHIRRLLSFEGTPTVIDDIWLPGLRFKGLTAERLATHEGPLYALFESEFGTRMLSAIERVSAGIANRSVAATLKLPVGTPILLVERVSKTYEGRKVELRRGTYHTEAYHYLNELR